MESALEKLPINWKVLPIEALVKAEWNYKSEDEAMSAALEQNIKTNGQIENIIVRPIENNKYEIVNGNHRYDVFTKLGITKVVVYDIGQCSVEEAKLKALITNETRFVNDALKIGHLLKDVSVKMPLDEIRAMLPFDNVQLDGYLKLADFSWDQFTPTGNGSDVETRELSDDPFTQVKFSLPEEIAEQLLNQIDRIKKALNPTLSDAEIKEISSVSAIECLCQHLAQIPDDQLA